MSSMKSSCQVAGRLLSVMGLEHLAIVLAVFLVGCAASLRAAPAEQFGLLQELRAHELRVASVSYRLALANRAVCPGAVVPQLGFTLHGIEQYEVADRDRVTAGFALGRHAGVMAVVPFSPADKAGLAADDQLVSVNGRALLPLAGDAGTATDARVVAVRQILVAAMTTGAVAIRVAGPRGVRDVRFVAQTGCPANVELAPAMGANAWADGRAVLIGAGLVKLCDTDDDLALVIAHELAHNLLRHAERLARVDVATSRVPGARSAAMRETEEEADRLGIRLATAAGYDLRGAEPFLRELMASIGPDQPATTHPGTARRLSLLSVDIAEVSAMRRPGLARARS